MSVQVREVPVKRHHTLQRFEGVDHLDPLLERIRQTGAEVSSRLGRGRVWMLNSTATGGGVAEMLPALLDLLHDVGVDARWLVLQPDEARFFTVTKTIHNMLHGAPGALESADVRGIYETVNQEAAAALGRVDRGDVLVVHDPQPAGVAGFLRPQQRPLLFWRCHIGTTTPNASTAAAWSFLQPYLASYDRYIFSAEAYVPPGLSGRAGIIYPGIDPLSHKNRPLRPLKLHGVLRAASLIDGPEVPEWSQFPARALRYTGGQWRHSPIPGLLDGPVILQVSRFDSLKGFEQLIPAFARMAELAPAYAARLHASATRVLSELSCTQLVLAGPDPAGVSDDPEATVVMERLCRQHDALPDALRRRVHLLRLPMVDGKTNALMVNALQSLASVVTQLSLKEGFGLTASEAMWKGAPVLCTNVDGLAVQIRNGIDGLLVDDPRDSDAVADRLIEVLGRPQEADARARNARVRVRDHFLVLGQVERWLEELKRALTARSAAPA